MKLFNADPSSKLARIESISERALSELLQFGGVVFEYGNPATPPIGLGFGFSNGAEDVVMVHPSTSIGHLAISYGMRMRNHGSLGSRHLGFY